MEATIGPATDAAAPGGFTPRTRDRKTLPSNRRLAAMLLLSAAALAAAGVSMPAQAEKPDPNHPAVRRALPDLNSDGATAARAANAGKVHLEPQPLNDTGVTAGQCYAAGSDVLVSCASADALALNDQQDGMVGRDVTDNDDSDGSDGFSFSLVPAAGGGFYKKTQCVKDNVTGLTWEGKGAFGPHGARKTYTNRGDGSRRDASAYVTYVNSMALCGHSDWRLPTYGELQSIVSYGAYPAPTIDIGWFPNTVAGRYWTSSPYAGDSDAAWRVDFRFGYVFNDSRVSYGYVRLVR